MRLFGIASAAVVIVGKAKLIGRSLLGGTIRSQTQSSAMESPSFALSILGLAIEQLLVPSKRGNRAILQVALSDHVTHPQS